MAFIVSYKSRQKSHRESKVCAGQVSAMKTGEARVSIIIDDIGKQRRFQLVLSEVEKKQLLEFLQGDSYYKQFALEVEKEDDTETQPENC